MQGQLTTGWKILEENALHWEQWGEQYALYDALSGETHLLPDLSARLLQHLTIQPNTSEALARLLCDDSEDLCDQAFVDNVSQLLMQLRTAGLAENIQL